MTALGSSSKDCHKHLQKLLLIIFQDLPQNIAIALLNRLIHAMEHQLEFNSLLNEECTILVEHYRVLDQIKYLWHYLNVYATENLFDRKNGIKVFKIMLSDIEKEPTSLDYMNMGSICRFKAHSTSASRHYINAIRKNPYNYNLFLPFANLRKKAEMMFDFLKTLHFGVIVCLTVQQFFSFLISQEQDRNDLEHLQILEHWQKKHMAVECIYRASMCEAYRDLTGAVQYFYDALSLDPNSADVYFNIAFHYAFERDFLPEDSDRGLALFKRGLENLDPKTEVVTKCLYYFNMAQTMENMLLDKEAMIYYRKCLDINPEMLWAAKLLLQNASNDKKLDYLNLCHNLNIEDTCVKLELLRETIAYYCSLETPDYEKIIELSEQYAKIDPTDIMPKIWLLNFYSDEECIDLLTESLRSNNITYESFILILDSLVRIFNMLGRYTEEIIYQRQLLMCTKSFTRIS
jgi:tetratricopeptide (TPR) repeat protein